VKQKLLSIILCLVLVSTFFGCFVTGVAAGASNTISVAKVTGGIATVSTSPSRQATTGATVTVTVSFPDNESQYNHQVRSISVTGLSGTAIDTTAVTALTYTFTMPSEAVAVAVELEIVPLPVYLQIGSSGTPVLIHTYTLDDMEALSITEPQYYTGIDSMPSVVQGKGTGVMLSDLLSDLQQYNPNVSFDNGAVIKLYAADSYTARYTYDFLFGADRYYYPNLINLTNLSTEGGVVIEPMFTINSFQGRTLTRAQLDAHEMDSAFAYRFCFGLLPSNVTSTPTDNKFANVTVNRFAKWVNRIDIIEPDTNADASSDQAAATTAPTATPEVQASVTAAPSPAVATPVLTQATTTPAAIAHTLAPASITPGATAASQASKPASTTPAAPAESSAPNSALIVGLIIGIIVIIVIFLFIAWKMTRKHH